MASPSPLFGRRSGLLLALAVGVAGIVVLVLALRSQVEVPETRSAGTIDPPASSSSAPSPSADPSGEPSPTEQAAPAPLGPSEPVSIQIPSLDIDTSVFPIGLNPDGTLAVPQPGPREDLAAWFENSPSPGQPGPSIIEGHVDTASGPSVFFRLGQIRPGAAIEVERADGVRLLFRVDAVRDFKKASFPTKLVYGGKDLSEPTLRVITCSDFDETIRHHVGNTVVFAHLVKVRGR
ncbi:MAG TPA: class F sortase [Marmoricola sp.]|jgi:sortase (surface protein transpeptidase)|nr:class F sortase [Marmoricola sp.]